MILLGILCFWIALSIVLVVLLEDDSDYGPGCARGEPGQGGRTDDDD